jgi:NO-binding membrane sensor protein with MHYT domain
MTSAMHYFGMHYHGIGPTFYHGLGFITASPLHALTALAIAGTAILTGTGARRLWHTRSATRQP